MSAPNRSADVARILATLPHHAKTPTDEGRRANLFVIVRELNKQDGGSWGVLVKTDQAGKIPGDIIVWRETREHFDVISGAGDPVWIAHGPVTRAQWVWRAVEGVVPVPDPDPDPDPDPTKELAARIVLLEGRLTAVTADFAQSLRLVEGKIDELEARLAAEEQKPFPCSRGRVLGIPVRVCPE